MSRVQPQEVVLTTKNTASLTMGIASVVVGVLALLFGWVPFLGLLAVPVAAIGVLLAGIGLLLAMMRKFAGAGMPMLGGVLSIAAVCLPVISTGTTSVAISDTMEQAARQRAETRRRAENERVEQQIGRAHV